MSNKHTRDHGKSVISNNLPVVSKCLVIVLIPKVYKNSGDVVNEDAESTIIESSSGEVIRTSETHKAANPNGYNGKELLNDFKERSKTCYWNPSLVESIKNLEYKGFVEPSTILVTGADIHLENLRSAWGRRVLKAPPGFSIQRIGDVNGIEMQVIPQTQFMPLPDAICSVLLDLNTRGVTATLDVILEKLALWYRHITPPSQQLVFDSLGQLIKDRKIFHTGSGYFVVTPETSRLQNSWAANSTYMPSNASWLPYHPMYVPVFQGQMSGQVPSLAASQAAARAHMRSISCQVTTIEDSEEEDGEVVVTNKEGEKEKAATLGRPARSHSLGRNKEDKKGLKGKASSAGSEQGENEPGQFKRSSSLKQKGDKGKANKDGKTDPVSQEKVKEKADKTSIFSKIFGRKKKDRDKLLMPPPPPPPPPPPLFHPPAQSTSGSEAQSEGNVSREKEYATFSAQFPPPEWMWYQQQLEKQKRTETWVSNQTSSKASTAEVEKVTSRPPVPARPVHQKAMMAVPGGYHHQDNYVTMGPLSVGHGDLKIGSRLNMHTIGTAEGIKLRSIRPDNLYESFRHPPPPLPKSTRDHRKSRDMDGRRSHPHHHGDPRQQSEYDVIDNAADVTPMHTSNVYHSVSALSPVVPFSEESSTYAKLTTVIQQPQLGPLHSTPRVTLPGQVERSAYRVEGHEARDRIYGSSGQSHHHHRTRSSRAHHRSRRKAQHKMYNYYSGGGAAGSDISFEYKGKLPNKNSSRAQSRDSGVNCVGLTGATIDSGKGQGDGHVYENTVRSSHPVPDMQPTNHILGKRESGEAEGESSSVVNSPDAMKSISYAGDVYNSVVYGADSTNQGYNSVVYGSTSVMQDMVGGPSVMYGTISGSEIAGLKSSLQSGYYHDDSSLPASALFTCQVEINPTAHASQTDELHSSPESLVDVVGSPSPGVREVSGSSDGVVELAGAEEDQKCKGADLEYVCSSAGEENATAVECQQDEIGTQKEGEGDYVAEDYKMASKKNSQSSSSGHSSGSDQTECKTDVKCVIESGGQSKEAETPSVPFSPTNEMHHRGGLSTDGSLGAKDHCVLDSGFSSPRNPDGLKSYPSQTHEAAKNVQHQRYQGSKEEIKVSSDVNVGSSEHHSGSSTHTENYETHQHDPTSIRKHLPQDLYYHQHPSTLSVRHSNTLQLHQGPSLYQHHLQHPIHMYQPSAMVVPHPDTYHNNKNVNNHGLMQQEPSVPMRVPLHPNTAMLNHQPPLVEATIGKHSDRPKSIDLWKQNNVPSELHQFEEEQLAKKYGLNGEFEVMGVL